MRRRTGSCWGALIPAIVLYEYACHEGNYGLTGIMAGAPRLNMQPVDGPR